MAKNGKKTKDPQKLALGLAILGLGIIMLSGKIKPNTLRSSSFSTEPVTIEGFKNAKADITNTPKKIIIPGLGIDLEVKESRLTGGYWEVFDDSAGWGEGSGVPGEKGNQVIFAHAREGLFKPLKNITKDEKIYVFSDKNWYEYKVTEIKEVYPDQTEYIKPSDDEELTLYTCSGFSDSKRLIVKAKRT